ncbi:hypothetical protein NONO_c73650 [Nocardia nova SH22a]|uniref:Lipoprotein n=1 Tax=Nocardia nova SH22a TaxID=1415166 RepID=W5TY19_9NOCA|nr:hypothetical protein [Nocardia nova]AHH22121.1 hypothetical protein NONO_c73650 [Nocardia nova SH22a]
MKTRAALAITAVGSAVLLSGCAGSGSNHSLAPTTTAAPTSAPVTVAPAAYTTADNQTKPGQHHMTMTVTTDDTAAIQAAFYQLKAKLIGAQETGAYWVAVDCGLPNPNGSDRGVRLGNGKIAIGDLAAAQTGLRSMGSEMSFNPNTFCRNDAPPTAAVPSGPLNEDVALKACTAELERKYTADQLPLTVDARPQKVQSWYVLTGTSTGHQTPGHTPNAVMNFTCTAETGTDGQISAKLTAFEPR